VGIQKLHDLLFFSLERKEPKVQGRLKKAKNLSGSTKTFKPEPIANPEGARLCTIQ
jgi:hypothetical protein